MYLDVLLSVQLFIMISGMPWLFHEGAFQRIIIQQLPCLSHPQDLDLNNSYASTAKSVPEETCNQPPAKDTKEEKVKLPEAQQLKEEKPKIVEKVQQKKEEKHEPSKEVGTMKTCYLHMVTVQFWLRNLLWLCFLVNIWYDHQLWNIRNWFSVYTSHCDHIFWINPYE